MNKKRYQVLNYVGYLLIVLIVLFPVSWVIFGSFKSPQEIFIYPPTIVPRNFTFANYLEVFAKTPIPRQLWNTVIVTLGSTVLSLLFASLAAFGFSRYDFKLKEVLLVGMLALQLVPATVNLIPYYKMMVKLNLLNTLIGLILIYTAMRIPFSTWILKAYYDSLPQSLMDAALIDGCSHFRVFWNIMLPLSLPGIGAAGFLSFLGGWGEFLIPLTIASNRDVSVISVGLYAFFGGEIQVYNLLFAASVIATAPVLIAFLLSQETFISGLTAGSGK